MKKRLRRSFPPTYRPLEPSRAYRHYKMMWEAAHPYATPEEYTAAMQKLAKLAGL